MHFALFLCSSSLSFFLSLSLILSLSLSFTCLYSCTQLLQITTNKTIKRCVWSVLQQTIVHGQPLCHGTTDLVLPVPQLLQTQRLPRAVQAAGGCINLSLQVMDSSTLPNFFLQLCIKNGVWWWWWWWSWGGGGGASSRWVALGQPMAENPWVCFDLLSKCAQGTHLLRVKGLNLIICVMQI